MLYIDACSYNDYDSVIRFCLKHNITIKSRDKLQLTVAAEMTKEQAKQMMAGSSFEEAVTWGDTPLG